MDVAVGETPIFDELREALGMVDVEELIGHRDERPERRVAGESRP